MASSPGTSRHIRRCVANVRRVTVTGVANLAVKVRDLDDAIAYYERAGADVRDRMVWENGERADVTLGALRLTLFTHAIYEDAVDLPDECFLHPALFTDDLDRELEHHDVVWGPAIVSGAFGTRRIAFVEAPGGMRLEFMEQIDAEGAGLRGKRAVAETASGPAPES
jgi:catechol 2,3-dioxygenase-like lactoylglutathione lyase family enzyme